MLIDDYLRTLLRRTSPLPVVTACLIDASGHVTAEPVAAALPVPPFSNAAMDGFLAHAADLAALPVTLPVVADVPAGTPPVAVSPGEAVRIMTGAPVKDPVDPEWVVIPVENTDISPGPQPLPEEVTIYRADAGRAHIRVVGENISPGELIAPAGTVVDAGLHAALVSAGVSKVAVHRLPRVTVISTGDELIAPDDTAAAGQIPDSNRPMLAGLAQEYGCVEVVDAHAKDDPAQLRALLDRAAEDSDLIVTSGGLSAGAFEVVRMVLADTDGAWFGSVAQRPGAPHGHAQWHGTPVVCLAGNPVAAYVSFHLYVGPVLRRMAGHEAQKHVLDRPRLRAERRSAFPSPGTRTAVVPVRLDYQPNPAGLVGVRSFNGGDTGSHLVGSLAAIDGITLIPPGEASDEVDVIVRGL